MFRKDLIVDDQSYVELVSRQAEGQEMLALTLRGVRDTHTTLASVLLTADEVKVLLENLNVWLGQQANKNNK